MSVIILNFPTAEEILNVISEFYSLLTTVEEIELDISVFFELKNPIKLTIVDYNKDILEELRKGYSPFGIEKCFILSEVNAKELTVGVNSELKEFFISYENGNRRAIFYVEKNTLSHYIEEYSRILQEGDIAKVLLFDYHRMELIPSILTYIKNKRIFDALLQKFIQVLEVLHQRMLDVYLRTKKVIMVLNLLS